MVGTSPINSSVWDQLEMEERFAVDWNSCGMEMWYNRVPSFKFGQCDLLAAYLVFHRVCSTSMDELYLRRWVRRQWSSVGSLHTYGLQMVMRLYVGDLCEQVQTGMKAGLWGTETTGSPRLTAHWGIALVALKIFVELCNCQVRLLCFVASHAYFVV